MNKLWLLTMTQERRDDIEKMISNIYPRFNGVVALVNQPSTDGTYEILEQNKGEGRILRQEFTANHAFLMNHLLFYGPMKEGDWCLYLDSPESCTEKFIEVLPDLITGMEKSGQGALFWDNRPYLFKFNPYMQFFGAVHWGLQGITGQVIYTSTKDTFIINRRKETPKFYGSLNGTKYHLCYPLGNDIDLVYGKFTGNIREFHELKRRDFREYCNKHLNLNLINLNDMIQYMKNINSGEITPDEYFVNYVDREFRLSELFQLEVLGYDLILDIVPRRYTWSFKNYLKTGDGYYDPNFKCDVKIYQEKYNIPEG